ncbi:hypothetical protein OG880_33250 (plasmid) [Streptomyces cellulosae]|uniref:hypothetical protein n=1 Tax=Streptomyces cellulosae TaxID=1968 RepID=UPI002ED5CBBB|nr:hypothetical protein OG880_33250 [Streptomyces cellulosae]
MSRRRALNFASLPSPADDQDDDLDVVMSVPAGERQGVVSALTGADTSALITVDTLPAPYAPSEAAELDDQERAHLALCERAVAELHRTFITAGKALATINQARLYRETHGTFEAYVEERWGMRKSQAYRLIEAWPVGAALSPIGDTPPNEAQVRELLPVVKRHDLPTARAVYAAVAEVSGGRVTAAKIREAARALPPRISSPDQAGEAVRLAARAGRFTAAAAPRPVDDGQAQQGKRAPLVGVVVSHGSDAERERLDAEEHDRGEALNRDLRRLAEMSEQAKRLGDEIEQRWAAGERPLNLGDAIHDKGRIRRAGAYLHAFDPEGSE